MPNSTDSTPFELISVMPHIGFVAGEQAKLSGNHLDDIAVYINGSKVTAIEHNAHEFHFRIPSLESGEYEFKIIKGDQSEEHTVTFLPYLHAEKVAVGFTLRCGLLEGEVFCRYLVSESGDLEKNIAQYGYKTWARKIHGVNNAVDISVSEITPSGCVLTTDNKIKCWKWNDPRWYQLEETDIELEFSQATELAGLINVTAISSHSNIESGCAVTENTDVWCWQDNELEQIPVSDIKKVSGYGYYEFACGIKNDDSVLCWQLTKPERTWVINDLGIKASAIDVNTNRGVVCAVLLNGRISCYTSVEYFSINSEFMAWENCTAEEILQDNNGWAWPCKPLQIDEINTATDISISFTAGCVLLSGGDVKCWEKSGIEGTFESDRLTPSSLNAEHAITSVATGDGYLCFAYEDSNAHCIGSYDEDLLPLGSNLPVTLNNDADWSWIPAINQQKQEHNQIMSTVCSVNSGKVFCKGKNNFGQLGNGTYEDSAVEVEVVGIKNAKSVAVYATFLDEPTLNCAELEDGARQCWGYPMPFASAGYNVSPETPRRVLLDSQ